MGQSKARSDARALAGLLTGFLGGEVADLPAALRELADAISATRPTAPTPATLRSEMTEAELRLDAFSRGFDIQAVARIYSEARDGAGLGKYVLTARHNERADEALRWALLEDPGNPEDAVRRSARAYFRSSGEWERGAGYPFPGWAADPGKWLAEAARESRRRKVVDPVREEEVDLEANAATTRAEVSKLMDSLRSRGAGA